MKKKRKDKIVEIDITGWEFQGLRNFVDQIESEGDGGGEFVSILLIKNETTGSLKVKTHYEYTTPHWGEKIL